MKKLILCIVLLMSSISFAQGIRIEQVRNLSDTLKYIIDRLSGAYNPDSVYQYIDDSTFHSIDFPDEYTISFLNKEGTALGTIL